MRFNVELRTDDPKLIEILLGVSNRARFVKTALRHFISTKRGKKTLEAMFRTGTGFGNRRIEPSRTNVRKKKAAGTGNRESEKLKDRRKQDKAIPPPSEIGDGYDFDKFL